MDATGGKMLNFFQIYGSIRCCGVVCGCMPVKKFQLFCQLVLRQK
jgi:hypothetical protein